MSDVDERQGLHIGWREVLASAIILGLLLGIALPLRADQAKKAVDARVKADLTAVEEAINLRVAESGELPVMSVEGTNVSLDGTIAARLHEGTQLSELHGVTAGTWCLTATNPHGKHAANPGYRYKVSADKIDTGVCS